MPRETTFDEKNISISKTAVEREIVERGDSRSNSETTGSSSWFDDDSRQVRRRQFFPFLGRASTRTTRNVTWRAAAGLAFCPLFDRSVVVQSTIVSSHVNNGDNGEPVRGVIVPRADSHRLFVFKSRHLPTASSCVERENCGFIVRLVSPINLEINSASSSDKARS